MSHSVPARARWALVVCAALLACAALAVAAPRASADATVNVTTLADPGPGNCTSTNGQCSLREAIELGVEGSEGESEVTGNLTINLDVEGTIDVGNQGELEVESGPGVGAISIVGPGSGKLTISGGGKSRVFYLFENFTFLLSGVTVAEGSATGFALDGDGGAGLYAEDASVSLDEVRFTKNRIESDRDGGAIGIEEVASLSLTDSRVDHNFSEESGGAIYLDTSGATSISGTELDHNEAEEWYGGAISQSEGDLIVADSTFSANLAQADGGGLLSGDSATVERTVFEGNTAEHDGGAIASSGVLTLIDSTLAGNEAHEYGGGLYARRSVTVERSTISGNKILQEDDTEPIEEGGGGIAIDGEPLVLRNSTVAENVGGGISSVSAVTIEGSTIAANTTKFIDGAGIEGEEFTLDSTILAGNEREGTPADCAGTVASSGDNLTSMPFEAAGCDWDADPGDIFGADPKLGALELQGGPTATMAPTSRESPAINNGGNPQLTDQRGEPRPVPSGPTFTDVGAVEVQAPLNETAPAITPATGLKVGEELTCSAGDWDTDTVTDPSSVYAWFAGATEIDSGQTHVLTNADAGSTLHCEETVDNGVVGVVAASSNTVELGPAVAVMNPAELDFGSRRVTTGPSAPQALTVGNEGAADLEVTGVSTSNPEFPVDGSGCVGTVLGPDETCEVAVAFSPAAPGAQSSFVVVETTAGNPVSTVKGLATDFTFSASPSSVDFPDRLVGTTSSPETIVVSNLGDAPMGLDEVKVAGDNGLDFKIGDDSCSETTVAPGEECSVEVSFAPSEAGVRVASLVFSGEASAVIPLEGIGLAPKLTIGPTPLDYGSHLLGSKSGVQPFVVENVGSAPAEIGTVALGGANPGQFEIGPTDTCTEATLDPGDKCTVDATFAPTVVGLSTASLEIPGDAPVSAALEGTGVGEGEFEASPTTLAFGSVLVSAGPTAPQTVTISNPGTAAAKITAVTIEGADAALFAIVPGGNTCTGTTLAPDGECEVEVTFDPTGVGAVGATLHFAGAAPGNVGLEGTGVAPELSIAPTPLDYGSHLVGSKSGVQAFVVTNVGSAPATIGTVALGGANPGQFQLGPTNTCTGETLAPAAECTIDATFAPTVAGLSTASLSVPGDAPTSASLQGTGTAAGFSVAPTSLDFGSMAINSGTSPGQTVVVKNTGTAPMEIDAVNRAGANPDQFSIEANTCIETTLVPGGECEVEAAYVPTATGVYTATIEFLGTVTGSVSLKGTGIAPGFLATPSSLDFGAHQVGEAAGAAQTVTVTNDGNAPLNIGTVSMAGTNPTSFALVAAADKCSGKSLAPTQTCTVQAVFAPVTAGDLEGQLSFSGNAPGVVIVHGFGSQPPAPPAPEPPAPPAPQPPQIKLKAPKGALKVGTDGKVKLALLCSSPEGTACDATLTLLAPKQVGRWQGKVAAGATRKVSVRLSKAARGELLERGKLKATAVLAGSAGERKTRLLLKPAQS